MTQSTEEIEQNAIGGREASLALADELLRTNALIYCSLILGEAPTVKRASLLLLAAARTLAVGDASEAELIGLMRGYVADFDATRATITAQ